MPADPNALRWREIDRLLLRNRKLCITELPTERLINMVDEMAAELAAVLAVRDEARAALVEWRRGKR